MLSPLFKDVLNLSCPGLGFQAMSESVNMFHMKEKLSLEGFRASGLRPRGAGAPGSVPVSFWPCGWVGLHQCSRDSDPHSHPCTSLVPCSCVSWRTSTRSAWRCFTRPRRSSRTCGTRPCPTPRPGATTRWACSPWCELLASSLTRGSGVRRGEDGAELSFRRWPRIVRGSRFRPRAPEPHWWPLKLRETKRFFIFYLSESVIVSSPARWRETQ